MHKKNYRDFTPSWHWLMHQPICFLAFGFGSGLAPIAPGTFGTLPALPIAALLLWLGLSPLGLAIVATACFIVGIAICEYAERALNIPDYGGIVWDEIAAMLLVLSIVPFTWTWWLAAFILFRLFDAIKPFPIRYFDRHIHGGLGIMLDDLIAALMVMALLYGAQYLQAMDYF